MIRLEFAIAWRYLRSRRDTKLLSLISVIAIGGIAVGVSALVLVIGVINGLQRDLREKILVGSPDVRVLTYGDAMRMENWHEALANVMKVPSVVKAAPFVQTEGGMTANRGYASGVYIVGIQPKDSGTDEVTTIRDHAIEGNFTFLTKSGERRGIVLGRLLAQRFQAWPGDTIDLVSIVGAKQSAVTGGFVPRVYPFEVTGIFGTGMFEYDNAYVYIDLEAAQEFAGLDDAVTGLEVKTTDRWIAPTVASDITGALGYPYRAMDWQEQNRSLFQALKLEKLGMGVILLLIVIVAAFNVVSTLTMVVWNKTREIGILRAMGMPARSVRNIFFYQGVIIGAVGTVIGLVLGLALALALGKYHFIKLDPEVYLIDHLPVLIAAGDLIRIVLWSLIIAALATIYPAMQAARLYPVEAIRSDS